MSVIYVYKIYVTYYIYMCIYTCVCLCVYMCIYDIYNLLHYICVSMYTYVYICLYIIYIRTHIDRTVPIYKQVQFQFNFQSPT